MVFKKSSIEEIRAKKATGITLNSWEIRQFNRDAGTDAFSLAQKERERNWILIRANQVAYTAKQAIIKTNIGRRIDVARQQAQIGKITEKEVQDAIDPLVTYIETISEIAPLPTLPVSKVSIATGSTTQTIAPLGTPRLVASTVDRTVEKSVDDYKKRKGVMTDPKSRESSIIPNKKLVIKYIIIAGIGIYLIKKI